MCMRTIGSYCRVINAYFWAFAPFMATKHYIWTKRGEILQMDTIYSVTKTKENHG